jgi:hypothetical protein
MSWYESEVSSNRGGIYRVVGDKINFFSNFLDYLEF